MSLSGHKGFRKSTFLKCSNWALRGQRLSLKMFQLSWKLMGMILTIFWTSLRYLGIDSRALRGTIGRLFSFLWLYNQPFYMPPNLPRALRKGAVSSFLFFFLQMKEGSYPPVAPPLLIHVFHLIAWLVIVNTFGLGTTPMLVCYYFPCLYQSLLLVCACVEGFSSYDILNVNATRL